MIEFAGRGLLLDVEGTTSAVAYVYEVMFPFARHGVDAYLDAHWDHPSLTPVQEQFAKDAGAASFHNWTAGCDDPKQKLRDEVIRLMEGDLKATGLKQLQGFIWQAGFESGELKAHVFDDVAPALAAWTEAGREVRIYSSGSNHAQRLFFGHSQAGNLLQYLSGHYDTTIGPKREAISYTAIAADWGLAPSEILFLSDITEELDAAHAAGMRTALLLRPGNAKPSPTSVRHEELTSFDQIHCI